MFRRKHVNDLEETIARECETVRAVMARSHEGRIPIFGAPCACPACGQWGLIDREEPGATHHTCVLCSHQWTITRRALRLVERDRAATGGPRAPHAAPVDQHDGARATPAPTAAAAATTMASSAVTTPHASSIDGDNDGATRLRLVLGSERPRAMLASMARHPSTPTTRRPRLRLLHGA